MLMLHNRSWEEKTHTKQMEREKIQEKIKPGLKTVLMLSSGTAEPGHHAVV